MTGEPENHTLHLLREMREENQQLHAATQEQIAKVKMELYVEIAAISADLKITKGDVASLRAGQKIVETELRALRGRVERIEDLLEKADA